jgi:uncharacterized protein (TIGR03435 family)
MQKVIHIGANCLNASCLLLATHLLAAQAFAQSSAAQPQSPQPQDTQPAATLQQPAKSLTYEVVSIKPSNPDADGSRMRTLPEGFAWINTPFFSLLKSAYGVYMDNQFSGVPNWVRDERYDVEAKVDADTAERWKTLPRGGRSQEEHLMMQSVLADRCQLKAHEETKELPIYEMVVAKGGLKLKEAPPDEPSSARISRGHLTGHAMKITVIVGQFGGTDGRMVIDKTGLGDTKYDFDLTWTPEDQRATAAGDAPPSLYTALEEQLGLKLVPAKSQLKVVIVEHIEHPTPN